MFQSRSIFLLQVIVSLCSCYPYRPRYNSFRGEIGVHCMYIGQRYKQFNHNQSTTLYMAILLQADGWKGGDCCSTLAESRATTTYKQSKYRQNVNHLYIYICTNMGTCQYRHKRALVASSMAATPQFPCWNSVHASHA